jgi:hypothetical protein
MEGNLYNNISQKTTYFKIKILRCYILLLYYSIIASFIVRIKEKRDWQGGGGGGGSVLCPWWGGGGGERIPGYFAVGRTCCFKGREKQCLLNHIHWIQIHIQAFWCNRIPDLDPNTGFWTENGKEWEIGDGGSHLRCVSCDGEGDPNKTTAKRVDLFRYYCLCIVILQSPFSPGQADLTLITGRIWNVIAWVVVIELWTLEQTYVMHTYPKVDVFFITETLGTVASKICWYIPTSHECWAQSMKFMFMYVNEMDTVDIRIVLFLYDWLYW